MSEFIKASSPALSFCISGGYVFSICNNDLIKADASCGEIKKSKTVFEKDGKARLIRAGGNFIAVSDFCDLHIFDKGSLEKIKSFRLGNDLTDDICGLFASGDFVYACIRNGKVVRIRTGDFDVDFFGIGEASSWALCEYKDRLIFGTVDGNVVILKKSDMSEVGKIKLSTQNIRSLYTDGDALYTAGQDKKLYVIDIETLEVLQRRNNLHKKMFDVIGIHEKILYTVSHPCGEISAWDESGKLIKTIPYKLHLSGSSYIYGDAILISSRSISGVEKILL